MKYSFSVFLVPRVANRERAADVAVHFIRVDEVSQEELERLEKLNVLIREKHIPIANLGLFKAGEVVAELQTQLPYGVNMSTHIRAWKHYGVQPPGGDPHPERTRSEYCIYDEVHEDYVYTQTWVEKLRRALSDAREFERVAGRPPVLK